MHVDGTEVGSMRRPATPDSSVASRSGRHDAGVGVLAVPAELHPAAQPRMQGQQDLIAGVGDDQRRRGDVPGTQLRRQLSSRPSRNASTECRSASWAASGADQSVSRAIADSRTGSVISAPADRLPARVARLRRSAG